jgi:hypothetical protein
MTKEMIALTWLFICQICNFADASFTLYAVAHGVEEINPVMAWALNTSPLLFIFIKLLLFSLAIDFIAKKRPSLLKWIAVLFMSVVAWHISFIFVI